MFMDKTVTFGRESNTRGLHDRRSLGVLLLALMAPMASADHHLDIESTAAVEIDSSPQADDGDDSAAASEVVTPQQAPDEEESQGASGTARVDEIIVTGSRIRRDEFSSASPIEIIDGQSSRELGLVDTTSLLQSATSATGTQIDNTFNAFVLDNGPGSAQLNLRGLGPERVLLLLNSKRLAPAGVGGAPTSPDLTLIPNIMIDHIEFLLDGASSVYGSDAVSGVANVIMRSDFEGLEFEAEVVRPSSPGGVERQLSLAWGNSEDNWTLGIGAEHYERSRIRMRDRDFTDQCNRYLYEDENGVERSDLLGLAPGSTLSPCRLGTINRVFIPVGFGNVWHTPGTSNIGIPDFSETELPLRFAGTHPSLVGVDLNGDGIPDTMLVDPDGNGITEIDLQTDKYNENGSVRDRASDLLLGQQRTNLYSYGEYDLGRGNTTLYYEGLYSRRETEVFSSGANLFVGVPAYNPYNPCNQQAPGGVNCLGFFGADFGDLPVTPVIAVRGDRDNNDITVEQIRLVGGAEGDLPDWSNDFGFGNLGYEAFFSYSRSDGREKIHGVLTEPLQYSLASSRIDPVSEQIVCGTGADCVPVNLFADSLYQPGGGGFSTQAERDFLFGVRSFDTEVLQWNFSALLQGDLFQLPWNHTAVPFVLGFEYRKDEIDSRPNEVAREGLLYGFFKDAGAEGDRAIRELFLETEFQLLEERRLAREWSLNLSARLTEESTYGSHTTYSIKSVYTPIESLTLRGTYGTSYRAPNAHEQFLVGQSGFTSIYDPCVIPTEAVAPSLDPSMPGDYDPSNDSRSQTTLDNCRANGVDPLTLGLDGRLSSYSVEILRKGGQQVAHDIEPETSTSYTYGFVFDHSWRNTISLRAGVSYYDIEVKDSIGLLSSQFIVSDCYQDNPDNTGAFCGFINRDSDGFLSIIDSSFFNFNSIVSRGVDYTVNYQQDVIIADRNLGLEARLRATQLLENRFSFQGVEEDDAETPVAPEWEAGLTLSASYGDFRLRWRVDFISAEAEEEQEYSQSPPCETLAVLCRPIAATDDYWTHRAALTWEPKDWTMTLGIANIFDRHPPLLDPDAPELQYNNIPLGAGYDILGRRVFLTLAKEL